MRERLEQRLRLDDLRKLRRRRKACQRRPQNVVGVDRAAGGLVEFGQGQRGAQLEAAGLLLLGDGDGGEEGGFGGAGVGLVAHPQNIAARAMQFRFKGATAGSLDRRQPLVEGTMARKALAPIPASDPSWRRTEASQPGL